MKKTSETNTSKARTNIVDEISLADFELDELENRGDFQNLIKSKGPRPMFAPIEKIAIAPTFNVTRDMRRRGLIAATALAALIVVAWYLFGSY